MLRWGAAALLAVLALAPGCGGGELEAEKLPGDAEQVLTEKDVQRAPEGSPERAVLEWWRAAQYSDLTQYLSHFEPGLAEELDRTDEARRELRKFADSIRTVRPVIAKTQIDGDRATVFTSLEFRQPIGLTRFITTERPQAFELVRQGGKWVLVDDFFVDSLIPGGDDEPEESSP